MKRKTRSSKRIPGTEAEGTLALLDPSGEVLHVSPPPITSALRTTINRLRVTGELPRRVGVVSAIRGEGVTVISRSLALLLAHDVGQRVCIVDLNWSAPGSWPVAVGDGRGLADVLRGQAGVEEVTISFDDPTVSVLPAGTVSAKEVAVFPALGALDAALDELDRRFDHVLLDLPALNSASEALALAARAEALVMVVRQGVTTEERVTAALEQVDGITVLGVVLNAFSTKVPRSIMRRIPVP